MKKYKQFELTGAQVKYPCPDDSGLQEPVRTYSETRGVETALIKLFSN